MSRRSEIPVRRQIVYAAWLAGPGVNPPNDYALFMTDRSGTPRLVVREGDPFEIGPGDVRTILGAGAASFNAAPQRLTDAGQLVLIFAFTDGSQALVLAHLRERFP